jgi:DNA-binding HxlR family transcriptional regulator
VYGAHAAGQRAPFGVRLVSITELQVLPLLTSVGIIERVNPDAAARNNAYRLTPRGLALRPVLEELGKWSQVHLKSFHSEIVDII